MSRDRQWAGNTYGSRWMHRSLIWLLRWIDVRFFYAFSSVFVIPIVLIAGRSKIFSYDFLRETKGLSRIKSAWLTYRNHCMFAQTVIDKFAMYGGREFEIEIDGYKYFSELDKNREGFVILSSHIGNYEIAGYSLKSENKTFNALLFGGEKHHIMQSRQQKFMHTNIHMISIKEDMSHIFEINAALQQGEIVSIPADRIFGSKKYITTKFIGRDTKLPAGALSIATMRGIEAITVNVMKHSAKKYKIYIKGLTYDRNIPQSEQTRQLAEGYARELERMIEMYPTQWFNYFDFFNQ